MPRSSPTSTRPRTPGPARRDAIAVPPLSRAAWAVVLAVAAAVVVLAVTDRIDDPDLWQHLAVGRAIWTLHALPHTDVWTWPGRGGAYVLPSWLFRALLWPFWSAAGLWGVALWRWFTTLATFAIAWRTARRGGATGVLPVVVCVWAALLFRDRSQARPDTLVAVLLSAQIAILESRRQGGRVHAAWLVPLAWAWANAHISYVAFFAVGGAYLLDAAWRARRAASGAPAEVRVLAIALLASLAACFAQPYGVAVLAQPFEYALHWRHEPIFRGITELQPLAWSRHLRDGLPVVLAGWIVAAVARLRRRGLDVAEALLLPGAAAQMLATERFIGTFAVVAAPFLARDLADLARQVRAPAWFARRGARPAAACAACVLLALPVFAGSPRPLGVGLMPAAYPAAACDWIEAHGVRGRAFNSYSDGGWLLWRFWPDSTRAPFIDIHQTGTRRDRDLYTAAWHDSLAWRALDAERRFEWALLRRPRGPVPGLYDELDADSTWALVFEDDVAALFVRRGGALDPLARRWAYRHVPAGNRALPAMATAALRDTVYRAQLRAELLRQMSESPRSGQARSLLASLEAADAHWAGALELLRQAERLDPGLPLLHEREALAMRQIAPATPLPESPTR